ncbi:MAG TPA: isochorismatase family cysteine hydrolase [Xanthobacteraceae bacterium]|nr:isochorismatase family cysteine hydrolase [Xanthobacteraceae bacterium]
MNIAGKPRAAAVEMGAAAGQSWLVTPDTVDMTRPSPPVRPLTVAAEPQTIVVDAAKSALLIVDMQNDFCTKGGWLDSRGIDVSPNRAPIAPLRRLIDAFRAEGVPVVWVNWGVRKDLLNISPSLRHAHNPTGEEPGIGQFVPGTRSQVIAAGSWGAQVVDELNPGDQDIQITKHRFSAFWDTETDAVLRNLGVKTLLIGGVNMDQCVMTTLEDASFLGYDTILVEDGTATTSPDYCVQAVLYNVKLLFGFVTRSDAVLTALGRR